MDERERTLWDAMRYKRQRDAARAEVARLRELDEQRVELIRESMERGSEIARLRAGFQRVRYLCGNVMTPETLTEIQAEVREALAAADPTNEAPPAGNSPSPPSPSSRAALPNEESIRREQERMTLLAVRSTYMEAIQDGDSHARAWGQVVPWLDNRVRECDRILALIGGDDE